MAVMYGLPVLILIVIFPADATTATSTTQRSTSSSAGTTASTAQNSTSFSAGTTATTTQSSISSSAETTVPTTATTQNSTSSSVGTTASSTESSTSSSAGTIASLKQSSTGSSTRTMASTTKNTTTSSAGTRVTAKSPTQRSTNSSAGTTSATSHTPSVLAATSILALVTQYFSNSSAITTSTVTSTWSLQIVSTNIETSSGSTRNVLKLSSKSPTVASTRIIPVNISNSTDVVSTTSLALVEPTTRSTATSAVSLPVWTVVLITVGSLGCLILIMALSRVLYLRFCNTIAVHPTDPGVVETGSSFPVSQQASSAPPFDNRYDPRGELPL